MVKAGCRTVNAAENQLINDVFLANHCREFLILNTFHELIFSVMTTTTEVDQAEVSYGYSSYCCELSQEPSFSELQSLQLKSKIRLQCSNVLYEMIQVMAIEFTKALPYYFQQCFHLFFFTMMHLLIFSSYFMQLSKEFKLQVLCYAHYLILFFNDVLPNYSSLSFYSKSLTQN